MISFDFNENFEFCDADWERIATASGLDVSDLAKRYALEGAVEGWLRDSPPDQIKENRAKIDKVLAAARHLLAVVQETGCDLTTLHDDLKLSDVLEPMVFEWDRLDEKGLQYQGRRPLQEDLCVLWRMEWGLRLARSTHPITGEPGGPLVRFLMTVHEIVVQEELRPGQAEAVIRKKRKSFAGVSDEELEDLLQEGRRALDDLVRPNGEMDG